MDLRKLFWRCELSSSGLGDGPKVRNFSVHRLNSDCLNKEITKLEG
jgi:hypothetical protein